MKMIQPYTDEDLRQYPIEARSYMVMQRTQRTREIEAKKQVLKGLFKLQNEAKTDELTVQKDIMQHDKVSHKLAVINVSEGKVEKVPVKEIPLISQAPTDNIDHDDIELEKAKLKVERTRKNPAENSQLVKSSSAPKALQGKRKASEPETPLTVKNAIDLSPTNTPKKVGTTTIMTVKKDVEPPLKKAKSNSGVAVVTSTTTGNKPKGLQICAGCDKEEKHLHAQKYPKDGKKYCYGCHVFINNCCGHQPPTGGRICYQEYEDEETRLCSKHQYTQLTSEIIYDSMDDSS